MPVAQFISLKSFFRAAILSFVAGGLSAQTTSLTLSSAAAEPGGAVTLTLSLNSSPGVPPAALQWTFQYPSSRISSISVDDGPVITSAGKTALCTGDATAYKCMVVGANANAIANGIVAKVTVVLSPGVSEATITLPYALGTSAAGGGIPISTMSGIIASSLRKGRPSEVRSRKRPQPTPPAARNYFLTTR